MTTERQYTISSFSGIDFAGRATFWSTDFRCAILIRSSIRVRTAADLPAGAPTPVPDSIAQELRERQLMPQRLRPGEQAEGFIYFRAGEYARARATLIDVETSESEGFLVEF